MRRFAHGATSLDHNFAQQIRRKGRPATDKWHLDEVFASPSTDRDTICGLRLMVGHGAGHSAAHLT